MKMQLYIRLRFFFLALVCLTLAAGCREQHIVIEINADETCAVTTDMVYSRSVVKNQIKRMTNYLKMSGQQIDGLDHDLFKEPDKVGGEKGNDRSPKEEKERMKRQILAMYNVFYARSPDISKVEIAAKDVRIQTRTQYSGLAELFENPEFAYNLGYDGIRLEARDGGTASFTMYRDSNEPSKLKQTLEKLSARKFTASVKFILPGKIVDANLDHIKDHTTWSAFTSPENKLNARQIAALDAAIVITFETGGLSVTGVLDSKESGALAAEAMKIGGNIALTAQSDGYLAEPLSVTTTRVVSFKGYKAFADKNRTSLTGRADGIAVEARLYAPEGRQIMALHSLKVIRAVDDNNRSLEIPDKDLSRAAMNPDAMEQLEVGDQVDIVLPLPMPEFAIQAIERIEIEAETVTCGGWQSHRIDGSSIEKGKAYDIGAFLKDGELRIKKFRTKSALSGQIELEVTGAGNAYELDFGMELDGLPLRAHLYEDESSERKSNLRRVQLSYYDYRFSKNKPEGRPDLIVKYPSDMKREIVRFELSEIDLF